MTLTVCVGSSGSGKTTFLNDVHKSHKCTYIRQYHNLRPYIAVSDIPNFDPAKLPYWDIYIKEKKEKSIIVGGTIAGQFMAGLSGGQRKLLLFELIFQRTATQDQDNLLIVLDEPFAGVTDDFVPFIVARLNEMRKKHNILLVTNDHVDSLKEMADNTVTVSAIDRSKVTINGRQGVDREMALLAMSVGDYNHSTVKTDLAFFRSVEFSRNGGIPNVAAFAVFAWGLFLLMFWDSVPGSEALVLIAADMVSFFTTNPYFLQLPDWRVYMIEEAEALLHSSKSTNKLLKLCLTLFLLFIVTCIQFGCQHAVIGTLTSAEFFAGIFFDNLSMSIAMALFGLYTDLPDQPIQILSAMPFLLMIFFSTTFSPGAGVKGLKELRYLFSRFYLWCMLPGDIADQMEGCPESNTLLYLILSSLLVPFMFVLWATSKQLYKKIHRTKKQSSRRQSMRSSQFAKLQLELFGLKALENLKHVGSSHDLVKLASTIVDESYRTDGTWDTDGPVKDSSPKEEAHSSTEKASADGPEYDDFLTFLEDSSPKEEVVQSSTEKASADENV